MLENSMLILESDKQDDVLNNSLGKKVHNFMPKVVNRQYYSIQASTTSTLKFFVSGNLENKNPTLSQRYLR